MLVQREVTKRNTPQHSRFFAHPCAKKSPAVLAERGPPNNSHVPVLKQFGLLPLSAPLLGGPDGEYLKSARILRAEAEARGSSLCSCFCAQDARASNRGPIEGAEPRGQKVRGKQNCLSTGTCELFCGRTFWPRGSGTFLATDGQKSALAGVCFLFGYFLFAQAKRK